MTSLLPNVLFEICSQAPSPSKDFHHLAITKTEVIWKSWKISLRLEQETALPREVRKPHADFLLDKRQQRQMQKVFGKEVLGYSLNLCRGKFDLLVRLPDNIIIQIFSFLDLNDIGQLSKTCKKFQKMCSSEEFWEKFRTLQDKHAFDAKKIGITIYKKLLAFHQNAAHQKPVQRRQTAFF
ncbi:F-box only protein 36-like isoform X1 [Choloepus didactylus]|uniref:F-box only protein 36-like isoform X1 n=1 Tax=Choloepus didactylus TaxID=27675 RepID=UPI00189FDA03|nr:F-box only protein 36-like isoform X1 [Choloepus didactylus]